MSRPVLHDYWRSSASYRVRIALNLKGIEYDARPVDLLKQEQKAPAHLVRNPQGLVPVLEMDGLCLTQSLAIIEYLDETRPAHPLMPRDPKERARVRALAHAVAMEIHPTCNLGVVAHLLELTAGDEATKIAWMRHFISVGLGAVERMLDHQSTGRFCHGDSPTLADCCLVPQLYNARRWKVDLSAWPRISAIDVACGVLASFEAAHPDRVKPQDLS